MSFEERMAKAMQQARKDDSVRKKAFVRVPKPERSVQDLTTGKGLGYNASNTPSFDPMTAHQRTRGTGIVRGAAYGTGAGWANAGGVLADTVGRVKDSLETNDYTYTQRRISADEKALAAGHTSDGRRLTPEGRKNLQSRLNREREQLAAMEAPKGTMESRQKPIFGVRDSLYRAADSMAAKGQQETELAKKGLGKLGQLGVDVGTAGLQMVGDAPLGLAGMAIRAGGSAAQEARLNGAEFNDQLGYGISSGLLSAATEKISNIAGPFKKVFGEGVVDKLAPNLVAKLGSSKVGKLALSALGEGGEEFVEDVFQPVLQRATYDPDARFNLEDALYDAAIGAVLGGVGGVSDVVSGMASRKKPQPPTVGPVEAQETTVRPTVDVDTPKAETAPVPPVMGPVKVEPARNQVGPVVAENATTSVDSILTGGKRVNQTDLTNEEFNDMANRGDVAMDADQKVYKVDPSQHIDRRTPDQVSDPRVNAFQFDHPELQDYYRPAAEQLLVELTNSQKGGQTETATGEYGQTYSWRTKRNASPRIVALLDGGMSYDRIEAALDAIIKDHGLENKADAKRVEMLLDDMLSNGYNDGTRFVPGNDRYLADKDAIAGSRGAERGHGLDDIDADMAPGTTASENATVAEESSDAPDYNGIGGADRGTVNTAYDELQARNSQFHGEGANAARPVDVPTRGFDGRNISKSASTTMGAEAIPETLVADVEELIASGGFSYNKLTDRKSLDRADATIRAEGFDVAKERFIRDVENGKSGKDLTVLGQKLLNNAANAGDMKALTEILVAYGHLSVNTAQGLQAMAILRKMSPENQMYAIQRMVDGINQKRQKPSRLRKRGTSENVPVEDWMKRTGELLAKKLQAAVQTTPEQAQSVTQSILSDISKYAMNKVEKGEKGGTRKRTETDRIYDLFNNYRQYSEAWDAARDTVRKQYGNDPEALAAFEEWLEMDAASAFASDAVGTDVSIDPDLMAKFLQQTDQAGRDAVVEEIQQNIADQIPPTFMDKWTALRYVNMLGNLKTQVRNVAGNVGMSAVSKVNNAIAATLEKLTNSQGKTRSYTVGKDLLDAAKADFESVKAEAMGESKYSATDPNAGAFARGVDEKRRIFTFAPLEAYRKGTNWMMNNAHFGDEGFSRRAYARSLAGYAKANGVTAEQLASPEWQAQNAQLMSEARAFAIKQAQEQTFRDTNTLSQWVSQLGRGPNTPKAVRALSEGLMPFRKTPANVLVRAAEYSPLGIANAAILEAKRVKGGPNSEVTGTDVINALSKGTTGLGIFLTGMLLYSGGLLRGGDDEDEAQAAFDDLQGHQDYSLELPDGTSITMDWLTPAAMPLFMGAQFEKLRQEEGLELKDLEGALTSLAEPMVQMSMMQGVEDALTSLKYQKDTNLGQLAVSLALDYLTQGLTNSLVGQLSRSSKEDSMMTYVDENSPLPNWLQRELGAASRKMPGPGFQQVPFVDAWGRRETEQSTGKRLANNLLNPAFASVVTLGPVEKELQELADKTGDTSVFPKRVGKSFKVDGEEINLTGEQYTKYAETAGKAKYDMVEGLLRLPEFKAMTPDEKVGIIGDVYDYANVLGKEAVSSYRPEEKWMANVSNAKQDLGMDPAEFLMAKNKYGSSNFSGDAYEKLKRVYDEQIPLEDWFRFKQEAPSLDTTPYKYRGEWKEPSKTNISKKEVQMWAEKNGYGDKVAALMNLQNKSW